MNWYDELQKEFIKNGDDFSEMLININEKEQKQEFDSGGGDCNGVPFTAWGVYFVYFPVGYDGSDYIGSVPRNPCNLKKRIGA